MKKTLVPLIFLACQLTAMADRSSPIVNLAAPDILTQLKPNAENVSVVAGPEVRMTPGSAGFPGVTIAPSQGEAFDFSTFGHAQLRATNTGTTPIAINFRLDNAGDWKHNPWNAEVLRLKPGASGSVKIYFGHSYGKAGYALKPEAITQILLCTGKATAEQSFRIDALEVGGSPGEKPPVDAATIRVVPPGGVIFGEGAAFNPTKQLLLRGARGAVENNALQLTFPPGQNEPSAILKPAEGKWDLGLALQVKLKVRNTGTSPVKPTVWLEGRGTTDKVSASEPLAPGTEAEIIIPFADPNIIDLANKEEAWKFSSVDVTGIFISAGAASEERKLDILSVVADVPAVAMPDWLGKRPPVEGNWKLTLNENFDGEAVQEDLWMFRAVNHWDPAKTHFTKDNAIVGGGSLKVRYEKKEGFHNDDPTGAKLPYATGYLRTYDKWTQRYGYFESRLKIPRSPGLWPGLWIMPDRGPSAGDGVQRQRTEDGGMEFDIMETLTRWGPYRYNVAMHWDGYGKEHKALGSEYIYAQPDKDGYITSGMLWTPGLVAFYVNGKEVARWENERVADVPGYLIIYLPSGGWDNNQTDDTKLPADFELDYVRVWQRDDLASDVDRNQVGSPN